MRPLTVCVLLLACSAFATDRRTFAQAPDPPPASPSQPAPSQTSPAQGSPTKTAPQSPAQGQGPAGSQPVKDAKGVYTIRSSSRIVVLDVVVTDAKGNLVTDLKRDDFSVTEAKKPQTILNFDQAGAHALEPELTINSTADLDRLAPRAPVNIVLLDEFNTRFEDMAFARYSLKKFL